jgi:Zn-dependent M28 family amino/carboxypeptidase
MSKISAVFVHDLGSNYLSSIRITKSMQEDFEKVFSPVMSLNQEYPFSIEIVESVKKGSSDHDSFIEKGVPGFMWRQAGHANYSVGHTQRDTYEKAIAEYQEHSSIVVALTAYGVANLDHLISREDMPKKERAVLDPAAITKRPSDHYRIVELITKALLF